MTALALTVLLAILWVACIAFGYWHGGWRQVVLLAAMLLSYAVVSEWAIPNGHDLSARFHWDLARTTTTGALLYLSAGTIILGVIGSFALYRPRPLGATERGLGAVMGLLNGGLVLALILRVLRSDAFVAGRGETLQTSVLSRVLIEDVGYLLLAALLLGGIAAAIGIVATRRDDAREMALLASVGSPAIAIPAEQHDAEQLTAPAQPVQRPPMIQPPAPQPIYAIAPLIDWPANPPPGIPLAPSAVGELPKLNASPPVASAPDTPPAPLPARPQLPPRVPPPMVYPIADLVAAQMASVTHGANAPSLAASPPAPTVVTMRPAHPVGPPPGARQPDVVPPTVPRPPIPPARDESAPADVPRESSPSFPMPQSAPLSAREIDVPVEEIVPPVTRECDEAVPGTPSPVVRELAVTTHDAPVVQNDATPALDVIPDATQPGTDGGTMHTAIPAPATTLPPKPDAMMETAAIPAILPPPLPSIPTTRPAFSAVPPAPKSAPVEATDRPTPGEVAPSRAGYARVAVARQASGRPDEPPSSQPQPTAPPEPLRPPLPTGPRVHPCPACGYPVRDHARYCPNCGSRQDR
ncbi:MAG: CvpA family protein [Thermomicrobiales bacterium]